MKKQLAILLCASVCGIVAFSSQTSAQQKTAKACTEEWRADKAGFQAKGITEKAYVARCKAGPTEPTAAAPTPTPAAAAPKPAPAATSPAAGASSPKTAKACTEEWRADKAGFQAKGITEKAYVAECRTGTAPAAAAPPKPTPAVAAPAPAAPAAPPVAATRPAPTPAPAAPAPSMARPAAGSAPTAVAQFTTEAQAKASCPSDTVVWVNLPTKIYHFSGTRNFGTTKSGAYICEKQALGQGMRAAKNETHP